MKKLFLFASAAAVLATACTDDLGLKSPNNTVEGNTRLVATYVMSGDNNTRTIMENNEEGTKSYSWAPGDGLAVLPASIGASNPSQFAWLNGNNFTGDIDAVGATGAQFYGIYPWDQKAKITEYPGGALSGMAGEYVALYISNTQNYNHTAAKEQAPWDPETPTGSFQSGIAPAVALGTLTSGDQGNELSMKFNPVACYFVVPMQTWEDITVTNVTLQVLDGNTPEQIAGQINLDLSNLKEGYQLPDTPVADSTDPELTTITLECGNGVEISANGGTNFWFVVPAGLELTGKNIEVTVTALNSEDKEVYSKFVKPIDGTVTTTQNEIYRIWSNSGKGNSWEFGSSDSFIVTNIAQFVEYAYLVTNSNVAISSWLTMKANGGNTSYSSLQNMINWEAGYENGNNVKADYDWSEWPKYFSGVKPALIMKNLTFSVDELTGLIPEEVLSQTYYNNVYGTFINNGGYLPSPMGGEFDYTISGAGEGVTLTGLSVIGVPEMPYMFAGAIQGYKYAKSSTVNNINFVNATINVEAYADADSYSLLGYPVGQNFSNVTVTSANFENANPESLKHLFTAVYSQWFDQTEDEEVTSEIAGVSNPSNMLFAENLNIDSNFKFTYAGMEAGNFENIQLVKFSSSPLAQNGYAAILTIKDNDDNADNAAALMSRIETNDMPYSVVDSTTSYWTGTAYGTYTWGIGNGTAEELAGVVQGTTANPSFTASDYILNLMGSYNVENEEGVLESTGKNWWNNGGTVTVTVNDPEEDYLTITNVLIDGTKDGEESSEVSGGNNFLTLLGNQSKVNNLVIGTAGSQNGIFIQNNENATGTLLVAAISSVPQDGSSNITVNYMQVDLSEDAVLYENVGGGLYVQLDQTSLGYLNEVSIEPVKGTIEVEDAKLGYLAGNFIATVNENLTLYNPYDNAASSRYPFGKVTIDVTPVEKGNNFINLVGFNNQFVTASDLNATDANASYTVWVRYYSDEDALEDMSYTNQYGYVYNGEKFYENSKN